MRILLIEDDNLIGDGIKIGLEKSGFNVDWFDNGADGEEALYTAPYSAVILDLGLPEVDGLTILKHWRDNKMNVPVLILTALSDVDSRILGLNKGADDYLGKPFSLKEVIARINALVRRNSGYASSEIKYRNIVFNADTKTVYLDNQLISFAPREIALVELLLLNKNKVLSKNLIEEKLYSWDDEVSSNAVEVHIHHIRKKLGKDFVKTVNKIGYIVED